MKRFVKSSESILAMSTEKSKLEKRMEAWSDLIAEHLSKCAMYGDSLPGDKYNHWIEDELATWISDTNETICKHNHKKLKPKHYENILFGWLSDDVAEAKSNLHDLQIHNKRSGGESYPYVEVDDAMIDRMTKISSGILTTFVPLLSSINTTSKQEIETMLHNIIDPVCKEVSLNEGTS